jgi:amino acid transporter
MEGWITVFAWQAAVTSVCYLVATEIQGLVVLNNTSYIYHRWHGTMIMWAVMVLSFAANVYAIKILPLIQLFGGIMHVTFFIALIVPLVLLSPRSTPEFVFTELLNEGGWKSNGVSWCLGMLTVTYCFIGESQQAMHKEPHD